MMKLVKLSAVVLVIGCATKQAIVPTQMDVDRVQKKFPGYTMQELNKGKSLYENNCGTCHSLKSPQAYSEKQWRKILPDMVEKANKKKKKKGKLNDTDELLIGKYLITMCDSEANK